MKLILNRATDDGCEKRYYHSCDKKLKLSPTFIYKCFCCKIPNILDILISKE